MAIGVFFIILAILLVIAMPVGGVFGMMSLLPSLMNPDFSFAAADVARSMFAGMNSFTLLAVPLFMVSGMIMAEGGLSERLFNFFGFSLRGGGDLYVLCGHIRFFAGNGVCGGRNDDSFPGKHGL